MPRCLNCGNSKVFHNSQYKSIPQWSESAGFVAYFSDNGLVKHIENCNAPYEVMQSAWEKPEGNFDTCSLCGSTNIIWN